MTSKSSYFPLFLDITNRCVLVVGGGKIATDKLEKLLDFTTNIKIVAKEFTPRMMGLVKKHKLSFSNRTFCDDDLLGVDVVVSAVDDMDLQKYIFDKTREKSILVNSVDKREFSDFIFGSYIKEDGVVISISTLGSLPAVSKYLKRYLKKALPENLADFLRKAKQTRESLPKGKERMKLLSKMAKEFFDVTQ